MKIVYLHQYFKTPQDGGAVRSYYLAKALVDNGHEVEMITSHNGNTYEKKNVDGIIVHYLPVYYHNNLGFIGRIAAFVRFMRKAYTIAKSIDRIDMCYATSTPLSIGWIALRLKAKYNIPYYFEVRDLWPEAPVELGVIKNRLLIQYLTRFEKRVYQHASKLIALSPGIREGIEAKVPGRYASMLPNMADCDFFSDAVATDDLRASLGLVGKLVVAYTGAIGKVNNIECLVRLAIYCKKVSPNIHFVIAGDGAKVPYLKAQVQEHALSNVSYFGHVDKVKIRELLQISEVSLVSFTGAKVLETNSPNKFFDAIAAGKLIAINTHGWIRQIVEEKQCGFYFNPEQPSTFVEALRMYLDDPVLLLQAKINSRKLAENHFSKAEITKSFLRLFDGSEKPDTVISSVYTLTA